MTQMIPANRAIPYDANAAPFATLITGFVRIVRQRADGHRQIICLICPGELIEFSQKTEYTEIEAATDVYICQAQSAAVTHMLKTSREFRQYVMAARQRRADRMREKAWALGALPPAERIALFLRHSISKMPWQPLPFGGGMLTMQLSRSDIAAYLNTTPETLCRVIGRLNAAGLIRTHDPQHFEIPDTSRLESFAMTGHVATT